MARTKEPSENIRVFQPLPNVPFRPFSSCELFESVSLATLSRQRSRVRAPSSPPLIPKILESIGDLQ